MKEKRIFQYDILRTIAILGVLNIHVFGLLLPRFQFFGESFVQRYSDFAVPLFVVISAALFMENSYKKSYSKYISDKTKNIFLPYLLVSIGYLMYKVAVSTGITVNKVPNLYLLGIIKGVAASHLYFVPLIMTFYVLFPLLKELYLRNKYIFLVGTYFISAASIYFINDQNIAKSDYRWFIFPWLYYGALGFLLATLRKKLDIASSLLLIVISTAITGGLIFGLHVKISDYSYVLITTIIGLIVALSYLASLIKAEIFIKAVNLISKNSYKIYLMHYIFIIIASKIMLRTNVDLAFVITLYLASIFGSILLYKPIEVFIRWVCGKMQPGA